MKAPVLVNGVRVANTTLPIVLAAIFFGISLVFVYRSFYGMRIVAEETKGGGADKPVKATEEKAEA